MKSMTPRTHLITVEINAHLQDVNQTMFHQWKEHVAGEPGNHVFVPTNPRLLAISSPQGKRVVEPVSVPDFLKPLLKPEFLQQIEHPSTSLRSLPWARELRLQGHEVHELPAITGNLPFREGTLHLVLARSEFAEKILRILSKRGQESRQRSLSDLRKLLSNYFDALHSGGEIRLFEPLVNSTDLRTAFNLIEQEFNKARQGKPGDWLIEKDLRNKTLVIRKE